MDKKKTALVTGALGGIGSAVVKKLLERGYNVVGIDYGEDKKEAFDALCEGAGEGFYISADLSKTRELPDVMRRAADAFGSIDALVHTAATSRRDDILSITDADWDSFMDINLKATYFTVAAAAPYMRDAGGGSVALLCSIRVDYSDGKHLLYSTAKGATRSMAHELAAGLAPMRIRVNCVSPCYVLTEMTKHNLEREGWYERQLNSILLERMVAPEDVAGAAAFLLSDDAAAITGENLMVDGGLHFCEPKL